MPALSVKKAKTKHGALMQILKIARKLVAAWDNQYKNDYEIPNTQFLLKAAVVEYDDLIKRNQKAVEALKNKYDKIIDKSVDPALVRAVANQVFSMKHYAPFKAKVEFMEKISELPWDLFRLAAEKYLTKKFGGPKLFWSIVEQKRPEYKNQDESQGPW